MPHVVTTGLTTVEMPDIVQMSDIVTTGLTIIKMTVTIIELSDIDHRHRDGHQTSKGFCGRRRLELLQVWMSLALTTTLGLLLGMCIQSCYQFCHVCQTHIEANMTDLKWDDSLTS